MHSEESLPPDTDRQDDVETITPFKPPNPPQDVERETPKLGSRDAPGG
jgi:hypothetical protein